MWGLSSTFDLFATFVMKGFLLASGSLPSGTSDRTLAACPMYHAMLGFFTSENSGDSYNACNLYEWSFTGSDKRAFIGKCGFWSWSGHSERSLKLLQGLRSSSPDSRMWVPGGLRCHCLSSCDESITNRTQKAFLSPGFQGIAFLFQSHAEKKCRGKLMKMGWLRGKR